MRYRSSSSRHCYRGTNHHIARCTYRFMFAIFFFCLFSIVSVRTLAVWAKAVAFYRGRPSGHGRQGLGAIRAVWRAWRALEDFFSAGVDTTISRVFFLRRYFVPGILHFSTSFFLFFAQTAPGIFFLYVRYDTRYDTYSGIWYCTARHNFCLPCAGTCF